VSNDRPVRSVSHRTGREWALRDSNPRPLPCKDQNERPGQGLAQDSQALMRPRECLGVARSCYPGVTRNVPRGLPASATPPERNRRALQQQRVPPPHGSWPRSIPVLVRSRGPQPPLPLPQGSPGREQAHPIEGRGGRIRPARRGARRGPGPRWVLVREPKARGGCAEDCPNPSLSGIGWIGDLTNSNAPRYYRA